MRCPFCLATGTRVVDSRLGCEGYQVRRRRECTSCKGRFTSYETAELNYPRIIKNDGKREAFDQDKLRTGILRAIEKRPVENDRVEQAISQIQHVLCAQAEREIRSFYVGKLVMDELQAIDQVAYIRFASVYKDFKDTEAFLEEVENLKNELPIEIKKNQLNLLHSKGD